MRKITKKKKKNKDFWNLIEKKNELFFDMPWFHWTSRIFAGIKKIPISKNL